MAIEMNWRKGSMGRTVMKSEQLKSRSTLASDK